MMASNADRPAEAEVTVVTVNYQAADLTKKCISALRHEKELLPQLRALVVDGGSGDGSAESLAEFVAQPDYREWVSVLPLPINGGFAWANNQAILSLIRDTRPSDYIHLLNPDSQVERGAVSALLSELEQHPRCGAAGSQLFDPDGSRSPSAFRFPSAARDMVSQAHSEKLRRFLGIESAVIESDKSLDVDWVSGASVMFRSETLRETGLFDDGFFLYFEEVELMHRLRDQGWAVRHVPASRVVHLEGAITGLGSAGPTRLLPSYWYQSRRRYFALTGGRRAVLAANIGLVAGSAIGSVGRIFRSAPPRGRAPQISRVGFWPEDTCPSAPKWGDSPGRPPLWMTLG